FDVTDYSGLAGGISVVATGVEAFTVAKGVSGASGTDSLTGISEVVGTAGNDTFSGSYHDGGSSSNYLRLSGGAGSDTYTLDVSADSGSFNIYDMDQSGIDT